MKEYFIMKYSDNSDKDIESGIVSVNVMSVKSTSLDAEIDAFNTIAKVLDVKSGDKVGIFEVINDDAVNYRVIRTANPYVEKDKYVFKYMNIYFPKLSNAVRLVEELNPDIFLKHGLYRSQAIKKVHKDYQIIQYREPIDSYGFEIVHGVREPGFIGGILKFYKDLFL